MDKISFKSKRVATFAKSLKDEHPTDLTLVMRLCAYEIERQSREREALSAGKAEVQIDLGDETLE